MNAPRKLTRNQDNKVIAGVAAGWADYLDVDVVLVRVLFVLAFFFPIPFSMIIVYIAMWVIMPKKLYALPPHQPQPMQ